ncbi:hypothetical protein PLESTM_001434300 [Pleodorina starrii]|nr:hypothetical protein PLESTM_001434300 [Pleodorina starrii]
MGCTTSCLAPAVADLKASVQSGDGESALRTLTSCPKLLSSPVSLFSARAVTPMHVACEKQQTQVVEHFLSFLSSSSLSTVQTAVLPYCRRTGVPLPGTVSEGVRVAVNMTNSQGQTPLMYACYSNSPELVRLLLSKGADPWVRDRADGRTALHYAAMAAGSEALEALLGAIPHELLIHHGCRYVDAASSCGGVTALHYAIHSGNLGALRELLHHPHPHHRPDLHARTSGESYDERCVCAAGSTPLHFAAIRGDTAAALALLLCYDQRLVEEPSLEDPRTQRDAQGQTPNEVAGWVHPSHTELSALLRPDQPLRAALRAALAVAGPELRPGPTPLATLAAEVLRRKLQADVRAAVARAAEAAAGRSSKPAAGTCGSGSSGVGSSSSSTSRNPPEEVPFLRVSSLTLPPPPPLRRREASRRRDASPPPPVHGSSARGDGRGTARAGQPPPLPISSRGQISPADPAGSNSPGCDGLAPTQACSTGPAWGRNGAAAAPETQAPAGDPAAVSVSGRRGDEEGCCCAGGVSDGKGAGGAGGAGCGGSGGGAGGADGRGLARTTADSELRTWDFSAIADEQREEEEEEEHATCGVCLEAPVVVTPTTCSHGLCGGCAEQLVGGMAGSRPLLCPFCRRSVPAFVPAAPRFTTSSVGP